MGEFPDEAMTKHEQLLRYIENLPIGSRISVRKMARDMKVSEGTAYRAIKQAEHFGLVSTKERIGTVRVEKKQRNHMEQLTFAEVLKIVDGRVLGGKEGLRKTLNKFVIGAMELDAMMKYIDAGSLLIVGNRHKAHQCALEQGAGVLITGGFDTTDAVKELADKLHLPIISSGYDSFTVASMINRAIYDRQIKTKIMLIEDIVSLKSKPDALKSTSTLADWQSLRDRTNHTRFPVVDEWQRVIGIVTPKDVAGAAPDQTLDKLMTRNPITVMLTTPVASAAHIMVWEGIELLPVVDSNRKLIGVITRKEVMRAMQFAEKQPGIGETFENLIWDGFTEKRDQDGEVYFQGFVTPQMSSGLGTISEGVLTLLMTQAAYRAINDYRKNDLVMENMTTYFVRPLQIESEITIWPRMIEVSRKFGKVDVEVHHQGNLVAKAMITAQIIDHA
jgi:predicted transcriptional regulator